MPPELEPLAILAVALLIDSIFGEYPTPLHPVVWLGTAIKALLRVAPDQGPIRQFLFGVLIVVLIVLFAIAMVFVADAWTAEHLWIRLAVDLFFLKASFALRELGRAAFGVVRPLEAGDLPTARAALRSLCSRDPSELSSEELIAATVESLAENTSDSFVAPLFWFVIFGVPGALAYRAINTLDAMIGYRGRYEYLGKAAARVDDVANWIPARITASLLLLAGFVMRADVRRGWRILRRDAGRTPSPNAGRPMAAMAGLLGVELSKPNVYRLGDADVPLTPKHVNDAWKLCRIAALLFAIGLSVAALSIGIPFSG